MASRSTAHRRRQDAQLLLRVQQRAHVQHEIRRITAPGSIIGPLADTHNHGAPSTNDPPSASFRAQALQALDDDTVNEALDLHFMAEEFESLAARFRPVLPQLVFCQKTPTERSVRPRPIDQISTFNSGFLSLDLCHADNTHFLEYEAYVFRAIGELEGNRSVPAYEPSRQVYTKLLDSLYTEVERLEIVKATEWNRRRTTPSREDSRYIETDSIFGSLFKTSGSAEERLGQCCKIIALIFHLVFGLAQRPTRLLLAAMRSVVRLTLKLAKNYDSVVPKSSSPEASTVPQSRMSSSFEPWTNIPKDVYTLTNHFRLDPTVFTYVCCPSCFALYPPGIAAPSLCSFRSTPASGQCGAKLFRSRVIRTKVHRQPVRLYHHQALRGWLARLLARDGIEDYLESPIDISAGIPEVAKDFWDGTAIRDFHGPAGYSTPYMDTKSAPEGTLRLVFSLSADGFNPFQSKPGKGSVTSTGIYMVCLNLPPHLRYLPENVYFVGIIPGHPALEQLNHFLRLIVDDLLPFWQTGLFFSQTAKHRHGRWVNAALIPVVADLGASRQLGGFASYSMMFFCNSCYLTLDEMENFDMASWPPRILADHLRAAQAWRDAGSTAARESIFKDTGIRWTEFLRLPYWNPLIFLLLESMHNHYLGLLEDLCREAWGMGLKVLDGEGLTSPKTSPPARPSKADMEAGRRCLLYGTEAKLKACKRAVLWWLCAERGLRRASTISKMVRELMRWRSRERLPVPPPPAGAVIPLAHVQAGDFSRGHGEHDESPAVSLSSQPPPDPSAGSSSTGPQPLPGHNHVQGSNVGVRVWPQIKADELPEEMQPIASFIIQGERILHDGLSRNSLRGCGKPALQYMCRRRNLDDQGTVNVLLDRLIDHRDRFTADSTEVTETSMQVDEQANSATESVARTPAMQDSTDRSPLAQAPASESQHSAEQPPSTPLAQSAPSDMGDMSEKHLDEIARSRGTHVLGAVTLSLLHARAPCTELPSWISPAPSGFGTKTRGKLSADQWRTVCTIHLPITLIPLWAISPSTRLQDMLKNLMNLVSAINVAGQLQISARDIQLYDEYILEYLTDFKRLYPEVTIKANHHLAMHLSKFLRMFGPVHSWRAFGFERINYLLQRLNTNMRVGLLETTFLFQVCRAANLRPILQNADLREDIPEVIEVYEQLQEEDRRGTRIAEAVRLSHGATVYGFKRDPSNSEAVELERLLYEALVERLNFEARQELCLSRFRSFHVLPSNGQYFLARKAVLMKDILINGVTYRPKTTDGNMLFRDSTSSLCAARLEYVVVLDKQSHADRPKNLEQNVFLVVARFAPLSTEDSPHDRYKKFSSGGFLCYNELPSPMEAIRPAQVVCHFAKTIMSISGITKECVHVLPLNRLQLM